MSARLFQDHRVLVIGTGVSGRSVVEALLTAGADVTVTVTDGSTAWLAEWKTFRQRGVELAPDLGAPPAGTDLVVTSPGVRPEAPLLNAARTSGIDVIGEVEFAWRLDQDKAHAGRSEPPSSFDEPSEPAVWLAVTGTNGKTTTVGMVESILRAAGTDAVACGNVGLPVVEAVRSGHRVLAVELSSFQLYWSSSLAPRSSVVLNVAHDHLDWHGSLTEYADAKAAIYTRCASAVVNLDDEWSRRLVSAAPDGTPHIGYSHAAPEAGQLGVADGQLIDRAFGPADGVVLASLTDIRPAGPHNVTNALAAATLARSYGVDPAAVAEGLRTFEPGSHRSVLVAEIDGLSYVDDSKATNSHAAAAALSAYSRVVWIAGGLLKGAQVDELVAAHAHRLDGVVLLGQDRSQFAEALAQHAPEVPVREVTSRDDEAMPSAVRLARDMAMPGSVVLLAPAAASMDMFTNYAHRGQAFVDAVHTALSSSTADTRRGW